LPQVYGLLQGFNIIEEKKAKAMKDQSRGPSTRQVPGGAITKQEVSSVQSLKHLPFVKSTKKKS